MYLTTNIKLYRREVNFLSHYYFDRYAVFPEQVLGGLLPDLLKNADKEYSFQLKKFEDLLPQDPKTKAISEGWNRHVEVDKLFHSSDYFYEHTHKLRKHIEHIVEDLPIRASFLAHIALELVLDYLLIKKEILSVERLYENLEHADRKTLSIYLQHIEGVDLEKFYKFYDSFLESKYIFQYAEIENIPHALFNICKRVWDFSFTQQHANDLAEKLKEYQEQELLDFKEIYTFINDKLE